MRNYIQLALIACVVLFAADAPAIDKGACCVQSTSRLESMLNPNKGSDESFFTSAGGPPNVMLILDTSCSMNAWPQNWPTTRGCNHPTFAGTGYDPTNDYRGFISGMTGPTGAKVPTYDTKWFDNEKVYRADGDSGTQSMGHNFTTLSGGPTGTSWTGAGATPALRLAAARTAACAAVTAAANRPACDVCLQTAGYFVENSTTRIAVGNYLDFYSPRDVAAVMTLSHILFDIREIRLGIMTFDKWGSPPCYRAGSPQICLWQPLGPNCNQLNPLDVAAVESQRSTILTALSANNAFTTATPLASTLYLAGYHYRSRSPDGYDALFAGSFAGNTVLDEPIGSVTYSICNSCSFSAAIILTDGAPNSEFALPPEITGLTAVTNPYCPTGTGACSSNLDEVAAFLWSSDIRADHPATQKVATYTIGFATDANANQLLNSTAKVGGGKFFPASSAAAINQALLEVLEDISSRNNSFSSAAVASVQSSTTGTPALLPRMLPRKNAPWEGRLWRFEQFNEFVKDSDLNGDTDKDDVFIVEDTGAAAPTVANVVTEMADGTFVRTGGTAATPFWEANERLVTNLTSGGLDNRKIWTVVDSNGDGAFTSADTLVRVRPSATPADDLKMAEYMGLRGSAYCPSAAANGAILNRFGLVKTTAATAVGITLPGSPTQADWDRLCVRVVMRWIAGADFFDVDGDNNITEVRPSVLGDIFHSSPVIVDSPLEPFLCNLGLSNQCVSTLYSQELGVTATPAPNQSVASPACGVTALAPYEAYAFEQRRRQRLALVGSNDGMIHAFINGTFTSEACVGGNPVPAFDKGNGNEAWAFIPPDILPKLADSIITHHYMVDGDIMVRDIWADTSADGAKQKDEFHTLAVFSEGRGGKHYLGLEMLYAADGTALDQPGFRWMFPQPCSEEAATFGKSFLALSPKPPPIGPVLIDKSTLPPTSALTPAPGVARHGATTHEVWMVGLSGGWSPGLEKGRGVYMVDAWDGAVNGRRDNLWWKFEFSEPSAGVTTANQLTHSVAAPMALVDYGPNASPAQDGFFDTAVFGDTEGQLWVARLFTPGTYSVTTSLIDNWGVARTFEMERGVAPAAATAMVFADGGSEAVDPLGDSATNENPFYYLPSVAIEPGTDKMRIFAGTGNRYALLEGNAGSCRFDNPLACSKAKCADMKVASTYSDAIVNVATMETHWKSRRFEHGKLTKTVTVAPSAALTAANTCGVAGVRQIVAENGTFRTGVCDLTSGTDPTPGQINEIRYECGLDITGNSFLCTQQSYTRNAGLGDLLDPLLVDNTGLGNNRFVGFWGYGGVQTDGGRRYFGETSGLTPADFDSLRLTERSTSSANGELINVTDVTCSATGTCDGGAVNTDYGWFLDYGALDRKTAGGAAVIASCVLWTDISPTGRDGGVCGASITPLSRIYQADFITGQPNCAFGFLPTDGGAYLRSQARTVVAPPPEPASVVQISATGQIRYSAMIVEPGQSQATTVNVSGGQDVLQMVYEVPVSRSLHNCRHDDGGCVTSP